tara:strand:+ start:2045 stop:2149 length:105 start_codon:yes stop_codon:yes gene_type:complete
MSEEEDYDEEDYMTKEWILRKWKSTRIITGDDEE